MNPGVWTGLDGKQKSVLNLNIDWGDENSLIQKRKGKMDFSHYYKKGFSISWNFSLFVCR